MFKQSKMEPRIMAGFYNSAIFSSERHNMLILNTIVIGNKCTHVKINTMNIVCSNVNVLVFCRKSRYIFEI